ncbi:MULTISPECIES: hypothetical protein [Brucella]|uniref:hypothetical protein n=1 Tax=Brucella TaxID=234 RepID=UPI00124C20B9|nr:MULTISPECIES: hypothetical protein [Brucella]KAB2773247.1 hypothetical protein F9L00_24775 [Brucella anthropi]MBR7650699.1 hypothetical protein [Brucella oryzae]MDG9792427.1 hypothetical protein [Brucella anthropi]MDH0582299.1 hypothetical protein [Brucella anthropi]MDH0819162.1 hypothetical protein [Brucella anthropi]
MFDNLNNLEASISAIRAFNHLIVSTVQQGDDFSYVAGGIEHLLGSQVNELERLYHAIRSDFSDLKRRADEFSTKLALNEERLARRDQAIKSAIESESKGTELELARSFFAQFFLDNPELERVGKLSNISPSTVRTVLFHIACPDAGDEWAEMDEIPQTDGVSGSSEGESPDQSIVAKIKEGVDASAIAQTLNLKTSTVERVIAQLLGGKEMQHEEFSEQSGRKAVNE